MYVSGGIDENALKVSNDVYIIEQLRSNHEEADTRMLPTRPDKVQKGVIMWQAQINICLFTCTSFQTQGGVREIFFKPGRKSTHADLTRFIPVHNVVCKLNEEQTTILLSMFALTGCDTCCALFGIGEKKSFQNNDELFSRIARIERNW